MTRRSSPGLGPPVAPHRQGRNHEPDPGHHRISSGRRQGQDHHDDPELGTCRCHAHCIHVLGQGPERPGERCGQAVAKQPGIGTPVRDGKFEFTVLKVKPGVTKVGNQYLGKTAQGQYVLVTLKVENIGDQSQLFAGSSQRLYDTQDRKFDADIEAAIYLGDQGKSWLNEINPGNTVTGVVVFDVPKGVALAKIELHDSMFSGGVDVALN